MTRESVTRWSQRTLGSAALLLVAWQLATLAGLGRGVGVALGLYGFVLPTVFAKAYSLVPAYFDRQLRVPRAPALQYPLTVGGALLLAAGWAVDDPAAQSVGALSWAAGALVVVGALAWTLRDNPTGAETGTGEVNAERRHVDRVANAFVPVALAYLLAGAYETAAAYGPLPPLVGAGPAGASHLLAAGTAALLLFAVGFRLLPRFLVATPPRGAAVVVLPAGAAGPALLAAGLPAGPLLRLGAALETVAVVGFAATYLTLFARSDRDRVGFWGPLCGMLAGVAAVGLGLQFAFAGRTGGLVEAHLRLNVLGLLGLTIVGVAYQFYPPTVAEFPGADDRTALASIAALAGGLLVEVAGLAADAGAAAAAGRAVGLAGAALYAALLLGVFAGRRRR